MQEFEKLTKEEKIAALVSELDTMPEDIQHEVLSELYLFLLRVDY
jgi:hypothetical protein